MLAARGRGLAPFHEAGGRAAKGPRNHRPPPQPQPCRLPTKSSASGKIREEGAAPQARTGSGSATTRLPPPLPAGAMSGCMERLLGSIRRAGDADAPTAAAAAFSPPRVFGRPRYSRRSASTRPALEPGPPLEPGRRRLVRWLSCVWCSCSWVWWELGLGLGVGGGVC